MKEYFFAFTILSCLAALTVLTGCNGEGVSSAERILSNGWADVSTEDAEHEAPLYCYKTIGKIDCYKTPDPRRKGQIVTSYPPKNTARYIGVGKSLSGIGNKGKSPQKTLRNRQPHPTKVKPSKAHSQINKNKGRTEKLQKKAQQVRLPIPENKKPIRIK